MPDASVDLPETPDPNHFLQLEFIEIDLKRTTGVARRRELVDGILIGDVGTWKDSHLVVDLSRPPAIVARNASISRQQVDLFPALQGQLILTRCIIVEDGRPSALTAVR